MNRCFRKKLFLKVFQYFQENTCFRVSYLKKNARLQSSIFIEIGLQHRYFTLNTAAKYLKTSILRNICEQLFERFPTWTNNVQAT